MKTVKLATLARTYKISGLHAEQVARYTLTGEIRKADNIPFWVSGDCGTLQIKSARATVCQGLNIAEHIARDAATEYGYVIDDFSLMYVMSPAEWLEFATIFGTVTNESSKNGGAIKIRLKSESKAMKEWFRLKA